MGTLICSKVSNTTLKSTYQLHVIYKSPLLSELLEDCIQIHLAGFNQILSLKITNEVDKVHYISNS